MPAAVIVSATLPEERVLIADLGGIAQSMDATAIRGPAVFVVGEVVRYREKLLNPAVSREGVPA
jgi:siroheme synthase